MGVSLVALRCRADRFAGAPRGGGARAGGERAGVEPRSSAAAGELRETRYEDDLRDARGCLLEAGGQVDDALAGGDTPVLLAADCSVSVTTLPAAIRNRPEGASCGSTPGDYNTRHVRQRLPRRHVPRGRRGRVGRRPRRPVPAERVVLAGIRDLDPGERELLERAPRP